MTTSRQAPTAAPTRERRWAWQLPALTLLAAASFDTDADGPALRVVLGVWLLAGLGVGATWQLLYRRDLVDRFRPLALLYVALMVTGLVVGSVSSDRGQLFLDVAAASIAAGAVLAESRLRRNDSASRVRG